MAGMRRPFNRAEAEAYLHFMLPRANETLFEHYKVMRKAHRARGRHGLAKGARMHRAHIYRLMHGLTLY